MPRPNRPDRDQAYVEDILGAANWIATYMVGAPTVDIFLANHMLVDAVVRQMGIIGEAAANLSPVYKTAHPAASWKEIVKLRNLVVHAYWQVKGEKIFEYATSRTFPNWPGISRSPR